MSRENENDKNYRPPIIVIFIPFIFVMLWFSITYYSESSRALDPNSGITITETKSSRDANTMYTFTHYNPDGSVTSFSIDKNLANFLDSLKGLVTSKNKGVTNVR